jgi:hypothetical protein
MVCLLFKSGLSGLGPEVIKAFISPEFRTIGERIEGLSKYSLDGPGLTNAGRISANHINWKVKVHPEHPSTLLPQSRLDLSYQLFGLF